MEPHPTRTLDNGFDDDGSDGGVDKHLETVEIVADPVGGRGGGEDLFGEGAGPQGVHATVGVADAHRGEGVAVVAGTPREQAGAFRVADAAGVLERHLHGDLDGDGSGVGEEHVRQAGHVHQAGGEADGGFMGEPAEHDVAHPADLLRGGGHEGGVSVAVDGGPPGAHGVDDAAAVGQPEVDAVGGGDGQVGGVGGGVGVPHVGVVEPPNVGGVQESLLNGVQFRLPSAT